MITQQEAAKGKLSLFWKAFMFFFMVPFPMFIYYATNGFGPNRFGNLTNPYLALVYLGVSVLLWLALIRFTFKKWEVGKLDSKGYIPKMIGWALMVGAIVAYYIFSYNLENNGTGWRFLRFWHPLVCIPLWSFFFTGIITKTMNMLGNVLPYEKDLLDRGVKTTARVISAQQTGTYINEQPQVRFELEFDDQKGQTHRVTHKRIVNLLNLNLASQSTLPIIYLPDDPQKLKIDV